MEPARRAGGGHRHDPAGAVPVPARSVAENVFLGIERARFGVLLGSVLERYRQLDERVGFGLPGDVPVSSLRLADQQKVEIMRALARDARLIVLDEPTSSLSRDESDRLHTLMRSLTAHGRTLVYVSHFLDEVLDIADTVTIMRDGKVTRTAPVASETKDSLIVGMLGRRLEVNFPPLPAVADDARVIFEARDLCGAIPQEISFSVRAGEIVGLAGLVGSGRTEVARMIAGADSVTSGQMLLDGAVLPKLRPHQAIGRGVVMLPEDRRALGLVMTQNARENITFRGSRSSAAPGPSASAPSATPSAGSSSACTSCPRTPMAPCATTRVATSRRRCSPSGRWSCPTSSSSTSPPAASTSAPSGASTRRSSTSPSRAPRCCSSPPSWRRCSACRTGPC